MISAQIQRFLPHYALTRWISRLSHCRFPWFKQWAIKRYISTYQVNLDEALQPDLTQYANLNDFFTRRLKPDCRPIELSDNVIVSPADGRIQQLGQVDAQRGVLSIKGETYPLKKLLAGNDELCDTFQFANFINIYLSPKDYHRVHMPIAGKLQGVWSVPGRLYAVNPQTVAVMPDIFARNERVICLFETAQGPMLVIFVGAMIVSGIQTNFAGLLTPNKDKQVNYTDYRTHRPAFDYHKGDELGYFEFGSTVIVMLAKGNFSAWDPTLLAGADVQFGQSLGTML